MRCFFVAGTNILNIIASFHNTREEASIALLQNFPCVSASQVTFLDFSAGKLSC